MKKKLIEYIREENKAYYSDVDDFFKDLMYNSPERNVNILANVLLSIEYQENKEDTK